MTTDTDTLKVRIQRVRVATKSNINFTSALSYLVKLRKVSVRTVGVPSGNRMAQLSERKCLVLLVQPSCRALLTYLLHGAGSFLSS